MLPAYADGTKGQEVLLSEHSNVTIPRQYFNDCGAVQIAAPTELWEATYIPRNALEKYTVVYRCTKLPSYLKRALIMYSEYHKSVVIWGAVDDRKMPKSVRTRVVE